MRKVEMVAEWADLFGMSRSKAAEEYDHFVEFAETMMLQGRSLEFYGLFTLGTKTAKPRKYNDVMKHEICMSKAKTQPYCAFRPGFRASIALSLPPDHVED